MFLFKESNGYYYIHYTLNGKRNKKSTHCKKKSDAILIFKRFNPTNEKNKVVQYTLFEYFEQIINKITVSHKLKTVKTYKVTFKHLKQFLNNKNLEQYSKSDIEIYLSNRKTYQARKDLIILKRVFNSAIEDNIIKFNPCNFIKIQIPQKLPLYFNYNDYIELIEGITNKDLKDLIIIAANTGMRLNELVNLRIDNIVNKTIVLDNRSFLTKTNKSRVIPLNDTAYNIIINRKSNEYIFTYNNKKWNPDWVSKLLKKELLKLGLNDKLNFHSLRHSFASWLVQSGVDLYIVKELLGHSSIVTTQIYAHLNNSNLVDAVNKIEYKKT